jgi:Fic-DOC domain mobile mystery protein B
MSSAITDQPEGATPIEDASGLVQEIATRGELNDAEALNIVNADEWLETDRIGDLFTVQFYRELHTKMYDQVWSWAGALRTQTNVTTNVGSAPPDVARDLGQVALEFHREWQGRNDTDDVLPFVARYHHALVLVYPFNNGNGRWSRLACDAVVARLTDQRPILWATDTLVVNSEERHVYIQALRQADARVFQPLIDYLVALNPGR